MDAISDVHTHKVVVMSCAQIGKTDAFILNTIGYFMKYRPAPIMVVQPTVNLGESSPKTGWQPCCGTPPALRGLINNKSRYAGNTIMKKNFPGGQLTIVGANAPTDLRGRPIKILLADEVDAYPPSAGKEGDPLKLAEKRQATFWDYKTVLTSTPTNKSTSRIREEYELSTQEEWELPCPHCGHYQALVWDNVVYDAENWPAGRRTVPLRGMRCVDKEYSWKSRASGGGGWQPTPNGRCAAST